MSAPHPSLPPMWNAEGKQKWTYVEDNQTSFNFYGFDQFNEFDFNFDYVEKENGEYTIHPRFYWGNKWIVRETTRDSITGEEVEISTCYTITDINGEIPEYTENKDNPLGISLPTDYDRFAFTSLGYSPSSEKTDYLDLPGVISDDKPSLIQGSGCRTYEEDFTNPKNNNCKTQYPPLGIARNQKMLNNYDLTDWQWLGKFYRGYAILTDCSNSQPGGIENNILGPCNSFYTNPFGEYNPNLSGQLPFFCHVQNDNTKPKVIWNFLGDPIGDITGFYNSSNPLPNSPNLGWFPYSNNYLDWA